jgi:hypothetical protein
MFVLWLSIYGAIMRAASTALQNILNASGTPGNECKFIMADMYTITLANGTVAGRYTSFDIDLTLSGNVFSSMGPRITRNNCKWTIGTEVTELNLTIASSPLDGTMIGSYTFLQACIAGIFDGARLKHERVFMPTVGDCSAGSIVMNVYYIADLTIDRLKVQMLCKNLMEPLNIPLPRNTYQPSCAHALFDAGCTLTRSTYAVNSTIVSSGSLTAAVMVFQAAAQKNPPVAVQRSSGMTGNGIMIGPAASPADWYALGKIVFTSGQNNGYQRTVKASTQNLVSGNNTVFATLSSPFPFVPAVGDALTVYPGCDRTQLTCQQKFSNLVHFKGFPFIPVPETLLGFSGGGNGS